MVYHKGRKSVLEAPLFLINDLDSGIVNELLKLADDRPTKIFGHVENEMDRDRIQENLDMIMSRSGKWGWNLMSRNVN